MNGMDYNEEQRNLDFDYFLSNYNDLFREYGKCFLAIRNGSVLGRYGTPSEAVEALRPDYPLGSYLLQECTGREDAYQTRLMGSLVYG